MLCLTLSTITFGKKVQMMSPIYLWLDSTTFVSVSGLTKLSMKRISRSFWSGQFEVSRHILLCHASVQERIRERSVVIGQIEMCESSVAEKCQQ